MSELTRNVHQYYQHNNCVIREAKVQSVWETHREQSIGLDNGQCSEGQYQFTLYNIVCSVMKLSIV